MELREYLSIRRAYNIVRQGMEASRRLTFVEFAILCRLTVSGQAMKTSEIAEYQGSLRPTMTHRTKHLSDLGLIVRKKGGIDRRNVVCELSDEGKAYVGDVCRQISAILRDGPVLSRTKASRIAYYIDAMGSYACMSGCLVLLSIFVEPKGSQTISEIVECLGLLQPTVSMAVAALDREGLVERANGAVRMRTSCITLTDEGSARARQTADGIAALVVRRKR